MQFLSRDMQPLLDQSRAELATFIGADPECLAFVPNATTGVNAFLGSFPLRPGDQLLTTDHAYNACRNTLEAVGDRTGAEIVVAKVPFPPSTEEEVAEVILAAVTARTRLALIDHVTSPTALIFPIDRIVSELAARGVETVVDGAHAPGMVDLDVDAIGAACYVGNAHKWLCAPKGAGFIHVRRDLRDSVRPVVISHGANRPLAGHSRFHAEFDWTGTGDPTPYLCVGEAIRHMASLLPRGWDAVRASNHRKVTAARTMLVERLGASAPCPEEMVGSLAAIPLPTAAAEGLWTGFERDELQAALVEKYNIEVPVFTWSAGPVRILRISAQLYNDANEYEQLADALEELLPVTA